MEQNRMNANVIQVKGISFVGKAESNHWVTMDGPADFKGYNAGSRPKELILIGLGGCTGADVASILGKMKEPVSRFEIDIDAESATEHPKVFTKIHLVYKFWGENINSGNLGKAISLSQDKYCSVSAMLKKTVDISYTYEVNPAE
jgi:putative redox protein